MSRDSNRFKLDPTIVALNSQTAGQNYGHVISQAFKDLGDIENNKINLQLADTKNQYEEIKLNSIKDELDDDRTYKNYILAEDKEDFLKNNTFKTSKHTLMAENYKNTLSLKEQQEHTNRAFANFTDEKGNFNRTGAFEHLYSKYKDGTIKENELYGIMDAIDQKNKSGIYKPKLTMQEQLDMMKTQAEIKKINSDTNKNYHSMQSENKDFYAPYGISKDDPYKKEKYDFLIAKQQGDVQDGEDLFGWIKRTGGKIHANVKLENLTSAKNRLTEQFNGTEQILNLINKYEPSQFGVGSGIAQKFSEWTGLHTAETANLESNMTALKGANAKALGGSNPSNTEQKMGEKTAGGTFNTLEGASAKFKASLERAIIAQQETINQINRAGYNTDVEQAQLNRYVDFSNKIKNWDGSSSISEYIKKTTNQNGTNEDFTSVRSDKKNDQPTNKTAIINSVEDFDKLLGL